MQVTVLHRWSLRAVKYFTYYVLEMYFVFRGACCVRYSHRYKLIIAGRSATFLTHFTMFAITFTCSILVAASYSTFLLLCCCFYYYTTTAAATRVSSKGLSTRPTAAQGFHLKVCPRILLLLQGFHLKACPRIHTAKKLNELELNTFRLIGGSGLNWACSGRCGHI